MAPRRKRSQTSDLAQDAEKRLDAATAAPARQDDRIEPTIETSPAAPVETLSAPITDEPLEPGADGVVQSPDAHLNDEAVATPILTPEAIDTSPEDPARTAITPKPVLATSSAAASSAPRTDAPHIDAGRPLAGDRPRPTAKPRRRGRALLLLIAAAAGAGLVFSGVLPGVFGDDEVSEGHNPPPRLTDARTGTANRGLTTEPRTIARSEAKSASAESQEHLAALREDIAKASAQGDERVAALTKRLDTLEKQQNEKIADLAKRLETAEKRLGQGVTPTAAAAPTVPAATAPAQAAANTPPSDQETTGAITETTTDPVIASTDALSSPLPQPRPSDLGSIAIVRPQENRTDNAVARAPTSPVLRSWVLRDVYGDVALIEGRYGMIEVVEGSVLPGGGVVENIRRAGGRWIVTTNRGIIASR